MTAGKNNWSNAFRSCFWGTRLLYPTEWLCKLHFKTIENSSLITVGVIQPILVSSVSVALNQHYRFLFLHSF